MTGVRTSLDTPITSFQLARQIAPPSTTIGTRPPTRKSTKKMVGSFERRRSSSIASPICQACLRIAGPSLAHERGGDLDPGGSDQDHEDTREYEQGERNHDLHRGLGRALLGKLASS